MVLVLDKQHVVLREVPLYVFDEIHQEENLNGIVQLQANVKQRYDYFFEGANYICHEKMDNPNELEVYQLTEIANTEESKRYLGVSVFHEEMKSYGVVPAKDFLNVKASVVLEYVLAGSLWEMGSVADTTIKSLSLKECSRIEALSKLIETWGVELSYTIYPRVHRTETTPFFDRRVVNLHAERGSFTGKRFYFGSNALEVIKEEYRSDVYTRIYPRGREVREDADEKTEETKERVYERLSIRDVAWKKANGDPCDKPLGQDYLELPELSAQYGFFDGTPRSRMGDYNDIEDRYQLIHKAYHDLVQYSRPSVLFKSTVKEMGTVQLGDRVTIIRDDLNIRYTARILQIRRNLRDVTDVEIQLGDEIGITQKRSNSFVNRLKEFKDGLYDALNTTNIQSKTMMRSLQDDLQEQMYNEDSYRYEIRLGNKYHLPAGTYYLNKPIDEEPTKAIFLGGGTIAIANSKKETGEWDFSTFATGDGISADVVNAGTLRGGKVKWNMEDGTFIIGNSATDYRFYWDGTTLNLRDVNLDLENNATVQGILHDLEETTVIKSSTAPGNPKENAIWLDLSKQPFELKQYNKGSWKLLTQNSKIVQLNNEISTKVTKGSVISEINQTSERIKIRADKIDLTGNVNLRGSFTTYYPSGRKAIYVKHDGVSVYEDATGSRELGMMTGVNYTDNTGERHLTLYHNENAHLTVSHGKSGSYEPYVIFDAYDHSYPKFGTGESGMKIKSHIAFANHLFFGDNRVGSRIICKIFTDANTDNHGDRIIFGPAFYEKGDWRVISGLAIYKSGKVAILKNDRVIQSWGG